jgi:hypothetical protein
MPKATGWHNIESSAGDHSPTTMKIALSILLGINAVIGLLILVLNQQL